MLEIADTITVIRRGRVVGHADPKMATEEDLAEMMVGREVSLVVDKGPAHPGEVVLHVQDLAVADDRGTVVVDGASFDVRAGEIFGIAGVAGNGQDELVEALNGLRRAKAGRVELNGRDVTNHSSRALSERGIAYIPGDRQRYERFDCNREIWPATPISSHASLKESRNRWVIQGFRPIWTGRLDVLRHCVADQCHHSGHLDKTDGC